MTSQRVCSTPHNGHRSAPYKNQLSNRIPEEWLKLYIERDYVHDDPAFRYAKTVVRPFRWFKEAPYDPEREPRAAVVVKRARDFGILDGFLIPVASTAGRMGQIWFGGRTLDLPEHELPALHSWRSMRLTESSNFMARLRSAKQA